MVEGHGTQGPPTPVGLAPVCMAVALGCMKPQGQGAQVVPVM